MTVGGCDKSQRPLFRGATPLRAGPLVHSPFPLAPRLRGGKEKAVETEEAEQISTENTLVAE